MDLGTSIRDTLLDTIEATQDTWKGEHQRLSSTGHCLRQTYYNLMGVPKDTRTSAVSVWEMSDGNIHEDDIRLWLYRAGYVLSRIDTEMDRELRLHLPSGGTVLGHIDGEIQGNQLALPHLLEIKSMSTTSYVRLVKAWNDEVEAGADLPSGLRFSHPQYFAQVQVYLKAAHQAGLSWPGAVLIAKAKDSSTTRQRMKGLEHINPKVHVEIVPFDEYEAEDGILRHEAIKQYRDLGAPPQAEYVRGKDWQCSYCNWAKTCQPRPGD